MKNTKMVMAAIAVMLFIAIFAGYGMKKFQGNQDNGWQFGDWDNQEIEQPYVDNNDNAENDNEPIKKQITARDYQDALSKSKEHNMPILIIFHADWCSWCNKMKQNTLSDQTVKEAMKNYVFLSVDITKNRRTTKKYKVRSLPAYVVANENGKKLKGGSGYKDARAFIKWLNSYTIEERSRKLRLRREKMQRHRLQR